MRAFGRHLSYANVMATVAMFLALGGGAYAISVPRDSVGPRHLKRNAVTAAKLKRGSVTSAKVRDRTLTTRDLASSVFPGPAGARADDTDPAPVPGITIRQTSVVSARPGRMQVLATVSDAYLTCAESACSALWGIYVDGRPVPDAGLELVANPGESDGRVHSTLFGLTAAVMQPGRHTVVLARSDSGGIDMVGELDAQLGVFAPAG